MQETARTNSLRNPKQQRGGENHRDAPFYASILLGLTGGVFSALIGFLLLGIHSLTGRSDRLENYGGVALLVLAFVCFGVSAHFMDESEKEERRRKKLRFEKLKENNFPE